MNKKIKMFASLLVLVFSGFVIYSISNKKLLVKADQQPSAMFETKLDANVYRGGQLANKFDSSLDQKQTKDTSFFDWDLVRGSSNVQHSTLESFGGFRLHGESSWNDIDNRSEVKLKWTPPANAVGGYRVERDTRNNFTTPQEIGTNYGKHFNVLNVAPQNAADGKWFEKWMKMPNVDNSGPVDKGLFNITTVSLKQFNQNPWMIMNPDGSYKYDSIFFGASDWNSNFYDPYNQDLTATSYPVVRLFGDTGRAVTFGHDTVEGSVWSWKAPDDPSKTPYHEYFANFAPLLGLKLVPFSKSVGSDKIQIATPGSLTENPYYLNPTVTYQISTSHSFQSYYVYNSGAIRWLRFDPANFNWGEGYDEIEDEYGRVIGDNNWYLVSKNNYAQIQTGHMSGQCTAQEAQIIFNMIYYTSSLNTGTTGMDIIAKDVDAPNTPTIALNSVSTTGATFNVGSQDNSTTYYYRAKTDTPAGRKYSDIIKMPVLSGLRGYVYTVDDNPAGVPTVITDSSTGRVSNINLPVEDASNFTLDRSSSAGKYLHIVAVDNANNVSDVKTIKIYDYLWWKYDSGVLTIYPHEINANVDAIVDNTDPLVPVVTWPWAPYISQITKSVIKPGVSGKESIAQLFNGFTKMTTIEGLTNLETSQVTDFNRLFNDCQSLSSIDLSRMNTKIAIDMFRFMRNCKNITSLTYGPNFNTSTVVNIGGFFEGMHKMTSFDLSHIDTRSATNMMGMFADCKSLKSIDISSFDTSKVVDMQWLFCIDDELEAVNLGNINTSSLTTMNRMFYDDPKLKSIKFGNIDTSKVTVMTELFKGCSSLGSLDLSSFTINPTTNINDMFVGTDSLWQLKMGSGTKITNAAGLQDPVAGTAIKDYDNPTPVYYATTNKWQEVGAGTFHNPQGSKKSSTDIVGESGTRSDVRTYVWDQEGEQTLTVGSSIDFGTHRGSKLDHDYVSSEQPMKLKDNRNARNGKRWRIEAKVSKPLTLVNDSSKKVFGNPLHHHDLTSDILTNLTSVNQTIHNGTSGSTYLEEFSYPWKMEFKASPSTIPVAGQYKGEVTYTLINDTP